MHKNTSPEEKLLSIIKGKKNVPEHPAPKSKVKNIEPAPRTPWNKIDDYISSVLKSDLLRSSAFNIQMLKTFNMYAVIIALLIAGYLILDIILVSPSRKVALLVANKSASKSAAETAKRAMPIETKSYSYYSNKVSGKSIFGAGSSIQMESQGGEVDSSSELSGGNIGLVGIIPGDPPQAIVEDKKSQKTYYLAKGQSINGITVEDISENKVVLEYRDKKMTLFL